MTVGIATVSLFIHESNSFALAGVERTKSIMHATLSHAVSFIEHCDQVNILEYEMEML